MSNSVPTPVFQFQSHQVRTVIEGNEIWFAAKDVCDVLDITWSGHSLSAIPDGWQRVVKLTTLRRGLQGLRVISEAGLYKLAFRSNKPEADALTNWVASEVLPSIRKTGKYEAKPKQKALPAPKQKALPQDRRDAEVFSLMGKIRFFIEEIAEIERRIRDIADDAALPALKPFPGKNSPEWKRQINTGCSTQALWSSINFALKAVEESIKAEMKLSA